jgi:hypothetical protein
MSPAAKKFAVLLQAGQSLRAPRPLRPGEIIAPATRATRVRPPGRPGACSLCAIRRIPPAVSRRSRPPPRRSNGARFHSFVAAPPLRSGQAVRAQRRACTDRRLRIGRVVRTLTGASWSIADDGALVSRPAAQLARFDDQRRRHHAREIVEGWPTRKRFNGVASQPEDGAITMVRAREPARWHPPVRRARSSHSAGRRAARAGLRVRHQRDGSSRGFRPGHHERDGE